MRLTLTGLKRLFGVQLLVVAFGHLLIGVGDILIVLGEWIELSSRLGP